MTRRAFAENPTDAKEAPARLNASRSYVPLGRKARYLPPVAARSHS